MSHPSVFYFDHALLDAGWERAVEIAVDGEGVITGVRSGVKPAPGAIRAGVVIPGLPNLHSHVFQRAMAGLTEVRSTDSDSFWTWRELMYRFVGRLSCEQLELIAAFAYARMLEAGFTRVCEFHYLHHDPEGQHYEDPAAMAGALARAAGDTGIGVTLLPVFYGFGGFGGQPVSAEQLRFASTPDSFSRLHEACDAHLRPLSGAVLGMALHSLRAVTPSTMGEVLQLAGDAPVHIHVAEQRKEVEECLAWCGRPPVAWLMENAPVDQRWCVVHATHMDDAERRSLARSGAVAGVCPITEANLGDGIFDGVRFLGDGGRVGIGSDSNTSLSVAGELAMFEYTQRLRDQARNRLVETGSTGRALFSRCLEGGAAASGCRVGSLAAGCSADFVVLDPEHPELAGREGDGWLDSWIFSVGNAAIDQVWVAGRLQVVGGVHRRRDVLAQSYRRVIRELTA